MNMRVFAVCVLFQLAACSEFSPGKLTESHASLEGTDNCVKCHSLGEPMGDAKCLGCHELIANLVKASRGYHSSATAKGTRCFKCHNEHHGREFQIVRFNPEGFDHRLAKYPLKGRHRQLGCADCHKPKLIRNEVLKKRVRTYLGLDRRCLSCHKKYHQDGTGEDCLSCHSFDSFGGS